MRRKWWLTYTGTGSAQEKEFTEGGEWEMEVEKGGEVELEQFWIQKFFSCAFNIRAGQYFFLNLY